MKDSCIVSKSDIPVYMKIIKNCMVTRSDIPVYMKD